MYKGYRMIPLYLRLSLYQLFTAPSSHGTMVCMFTLLSSLLLVSTTLATPSSLAEALLARGHEDRQSRSVNRVASRGPSVWAKKVARNWAGASIVDKTGVRIIPMVHQHVRPLFFLSTAHFHLYQRYHHCPTGTLEGPS